MHLVLTYAYFLFEGVDFLLTLDVIDILYSVYEKSLKNEKKKRPIKAKKYACVTAIFITNPSRKFSVANREYPEIRNKKEANRCAR